MENLGNLGFDGEVALTRAQVEELLKDALLERGYELKEGSLRLHGPDQNQDPPYAAPGEGGARLKLKLKILSSLVSER